MIHKLDVTNWTKNTNADWIFFFLIFCISLTLTGNFMTLKLNFSVKSLSAYVILGGWWSAGCRYLTQFHLKHLIIISVLNINQSFVNFTVDAFKSIYATVISNIQKFLGKGSGWIIDSVIVHNINISKYSRSSKKRIE